MSRTRLSPVDAAWLQMEEPDNLMMITAVLRFQDQPIIDHIRRLLVTRLVEPYPRFRQRLVGADTGWGRAAWVDDQDFSVADHLLRVPLPAPGGEVALRKLVSDLLSTPLDLSRSPWEMRLVHGLPGDGSALVARLHHSIADGMALAALLLELTDERPASSGDADDDDEGGHAPAEGAGRRRDRLARAARRTRDTVLQAGRVVSELVKLLTSTPDPASALRGPLSQTKRVGWSHTLSLEEIKQVASDADVTVNDVLLALAAGALRTTLLNNDEEPHDVRASVPVNLRPLDKPVPRDLGNKFGLVFVPLPLSVARPEDRLRAVSQGMSTKKGTAQAAMTLAVLTVLGRAPRIAEKVMIRTIGSKTSCVVTNVPGPTKRLNLAGSEVEGIHFWVPQAGRVAVGVSLFSYAGEVSVGIASDASVVDDPQAVADAVPGELTALADAVRGAQAKVA